MRGSIPFFWGHTNLLSPKPTIQTHTDLDGKNSSTHLHFNRLKQSYGTPIFMINLVKSQENNPERQLSRLMEQYLERNTLHTKTGSTNPFDIVYEAYDFFKIYKDSQLRLIEELQTYAFEKLQKTNIFYLDTYNMPIKKFSFKNLVPQSKQKGVIRYL